MRSEVVLRVVDVGKRYRLFRRPADRLLHVLAPWAGASFRDHWALRGVSFEIRRGEAVGVVGRNGSGKSTLLQLLCGILEPTVGRVEAHGRIAALLELGAGFNPEFTGRENARLNAAVLGMGREEAEERLPAIAAFADIGEFLDRPVKTYSSGMLVRLAFSVAIHVEPEILVVDEALAVGDEAFQRKCHARIESMRAAGVTVLFVSHSAGTVVEICDRAILLEGGELIAVGRPKDIVARYQQLLYSPEGRRQELVAAIRGDAAAVGADFQAAEAADDTFDPGFVSSSSVEYGNGVARIEHVRIVAGDGRPVNVLAQGQRYRYGYRVTFLAAANQVRFGMMCKTITGVELGGCVSATRATSIPSVAPGDQFDVAFEFDCALLAGAYFLNCGVVGVVDGDETYLHRIVDAAAFRVRATPDTIATGTVDLGVRPVVVAIGRGEAQP
jgi:lipopolysaccharide transport system ATP-binding protein